jgi:hypothetical protein
MKPLVIAVAALLLLGSGGAQEGGWGTSMMEVGYRFALAGRAAEAQNFALADYELDELDEAFGRVKTVAQPHDVPKAVKLAGLVDAYQRDTLPALRKAAKARDLRAFRNVYAQAVVQCNACHKAAEKPFLKVPAIPQGATFLDLKP